MEVNRRWGSLIGIALTVVATAVVPLPTASAQQCVPAGEELAPIPWPQRMLAPEKTWPLTDGAGQRVAVIGTGVAATPYLSGRLAGSVDLAPRTQSQQDSGRRDCLGVGTGVAGIIAARPSNTVGFHGFAPGARILSAKVVADSYPTDRHPRESVAPDTLAAAIGWSVDQDAAVIAVATITYQNRRVLREAVERAQRNDVVVVAAVGEASRDDPPGTTPYPAAYPDVIGVGAIADDGSAGSASRASHVDLVAPGVELVTTRPGDGLGVVSGTAFATGFAAAAAAMVRSYRVDLSHSAVARRLFATATPAHEGVGSARYGHGVVNPYHAVLDRTVEGEPSALPSLTPPLVNEDQLARQASEDRSSALASTLAAFGVALAGLLTAVVVFGPRGLRRRWRSGLAPVPAHRPEDERPEPPVQLFSDRQ